MTPLLIEFTHFVPALVYRPPTSENFMAALPTHLSGLRPHPFNGGRQAITTEKTKS
jgi:hypothetical protein